VLLTQIAVCLVSYVGSIGFYRSPSRHAKLLSVHHRDRIPFSNSCDLKQWQPIVACHWLQHLFRCAAVVSADAKPFA